MAVEKERVKARLKALFPKANLSQTRLDAIAAKLSPKPADDADDAAIDALLTAYNDDAAMTFEELAKYDDKLRTLEAKNKGGNDTTTGGNPSETQNTQAPPREDEAPAWAKAILAKVEKLENDKVESARRKQAAKLLPNAAPELLDSLMLSMPDSEEEQIAWAEKTNKAVDATIQIKTNTGLGNGGVIKPTVTNGKKEASKEEVETVTNNMMKK